MKYGSQSDFLTTGRLVGQLLGGLIVFHGGMLDFCQLRTRGEGSADFPTGLMWNCLRSFKELGLCSVPGISPRPDVERVF